MMAENMGQTQAIHVITGENIFLFVAAAIQSLNFGIVIWEASAYVCVRICTVLSLFTVL